MKILMTGATGLVGKELGKALVEEGHELTVLSRNPKSAKRSLPFPATVFKWEHYSKEIPSESFDGVNAVIHLAGESIAGGRWTSKRKKKIYESRILGTRTLVQAIQKNKNHSIKQFISTSAIGIYGDGSELVTEDSPKAHDFLATVCKEWEKESQALSESGIHVVNPRFGIVLSTQGGALEKMLFPFSMGLGGAVGNGKQWMSWIHIKDLVNMLIHFVKNPNLSGAFNAVAPNPVDNKEFSQILAKSLGSSLFLPVPALALKLALGSMSALVIEGQKVSADKIKSTGFQFEFNNLESALNDLCKNLKNGQHEFLSETWFTQNKEEIFPFFVEAKNLEKLTPDFLKFKVLSKSSQTIQEGTIIDYKLSLYGVPMKWKTLIKDWSPSKQFVDTQLKGPYKLWHHTHDFIDFAGGTLMRDRVLYRIPFGWIGNLGGTLFVQFNVKKIFAYRQKVMSKIFKS